MPSKNDRSVLRELAQRTAEIAALPVQEEKRRLWRKLNRCEPVRPMVMIDQICWNEMGNDEALVLQCEDAMCRAYETRLRRQLYQWHRFPVDMVVEPFIYIPRAVHNTGFGVEVQEETAALDPTNSVVGHKFHNQFSTEADLEKIMTPRIEEDKSETDRRMEEAQAIFGEILAPRLHGVDPYLSLWDPISTWMGVENALFALIEKPAFMHQLVGRVAAGYMAMLDQLEEQGLLCEPQPLIHCTGAYTDELPATGYDPTRPRTKDLWMFGLAQMFSAVSPQMFKEYEVDYASQICDRFGLVYYGCCDPLDGKMSEVRLIPNVRKVSMSPWVNEEAGAEAIGKEYVFSRKPNPAHLAFDTFDEALVRNHLMTTKKVCKKYGCPLELILKDISTIRYEPSRLEQWAAIAMQVVCE